MVDLQLNHLAGFVEFQSGDGRGALGSAHLVHDVAPVPEGDACRHADVPEAAELPVEAVEEVGVRHGVAARQSQLRQVAGLQQVGALAAHVDGVL